MFSAFGVDHGDVSKGLKLPFGPAAKTRRLMAGMQGTNGLKSIHAPQRKPQGVMDTQIPQSGSPQAMKARNRGLHAQANAYKDPMRTARPGARDYR